MDARRAKPMVVIGLVYYSRPREGPAQKPKPSSLKAAWPQGLPTCNYLPFEIRQLPLLTLTQK